MKKVFIVLIAITLSVLWGANTAAGDIHSSGIPSLITASATHDISCKFNCVHIQNHESRNSDAVPFVTQEKMMEQIIGENDLSEEAIEKIENIVYGSGKEVKISDSKGHDISCKFACDHIIG